MIDRKYLVFQTQTAFEEALRMNEVRSDAIVFIKSPKQIYTHGTYWNCEDGKGEDDFQEWFESQDLPTKKWVSEFIANKLKDFKPAEEQINYTAGDGISIENGKISLKAANSQSIGGIKLGYQRSGNSVPVRVNGQNQAYVDIPGDVNPSSPGSSSTKYYEIRFKAVDTEETPALPTSSDMNGWKTYAENSDGSKIIWMTSRLIDGSDVGIWEGPWRISGPNGENGVDGDKYEYIYRLSTSGSIPPQGYDSTTPDPSAATKTIADDDFVPYGWTDNPTGISEDKKYEWMSMRIKTFSKDDLKGTWSQFMPPVLWSAYGQHGTDGDGVEYIFYSTSGNEVIPDPYDWYTTESYYQRSEYIDPRYKAIGDPTPNKWLDDPYDIDLLPNGAKTYVSIRKKKQDDDGEMKWGRYSHPSLWAYKPHDGDAGIGVVADFDNDNMCVSLRDTGYNYPFSQSSKVYLYNGVSTVTCTAAITGATFSDGTNILNYGTLFKVQNGNEITVNIPSSTFNFEETGTIFINVRVSGTINGAPVNRDTVLTVMGIKFGTNGQTYSLKTSTKVIRKNKVGVLSPLSIGCFCQEVDGTNQKTWGPENIPNEYTGMFKFTKIVDDNFANETEITSNETTTEGINDNIIVRLKYNNNGTWVTVDQETIYIVSDGVDGSIIPAVYYEIQLQATGLKKMYTYNSSHEVTSEKFEGEIYWKIYKIEGNARTEVTNSNSSNLDISSYLNFGAESVSALWSPTKGCWRQSISRQWKDDYVYSQIILKVGDSPVMSIVVPTIIPGKDGKDPEKLQTLEGGVMRLRVWQENAEPAYNDGTVVESGIFYKDVVQYDDELFVCLNPGTTNRPWTLNNDRERIYSNDWSKVQAMNQASFELLIANSAYIKNLTAKQVVITDNNDKPVAGIVNGTYVAQIRKEGTDNIESDCGVRFFAGSIPATGNLAETAFNVDQQGRLVAGAGKITLNANGSGWVANGNISWDQNGNLTAFKVDPNVGGSNDSQSNAIIINTAEWTKEVSGSTDGPYNALYVTGFAIRNGFIYRVIARIIPVDNVQQYMSTTDLAPTVMYAQVFGTILYSDEYINGLFPGGIKVQIIPTCGYIYANFHANDVTGGGNGKIGNYHEYYKWFDKVPTTSLISGEITWPAN